MSEQLTNLVDSVAREVTPSLFSNYPDYAALPDSLALIDRSEQSVQAYSANEIFSAGSILNPDIIYDPANPITLFEHPSLSWVIGLFLMITFSYYLFVIYRYWNYLPTLFRVAPSLSKTLIAYDTLNNEQIGMSVHSLILLTLAITTTAIEFTQQDINSYPLLLPIFLGIVLSISLYKFIITKTCKLFSENHTGFDNIRTINSHTISLVAILYTPIAVASATNMQQSKTLIAILLAFWLLYIIRLLGIFIKSGFGKLQWFLYLCAVEILPVSFLLAMAVRY